MGEREDDPSEVHSERASPHFFSLELGCRCHLPHSLFLLISLPLPFSLPSFNFITFHPFTRKAVGREKVFGRQEK